MVSFLKSTIRIKLKFFSFYQSVCLKLYSNRISAFTAYLQPFLENISTLEWIQSLLTVMKSYADDVQMMEKLSLLFQRLSKLKYDIYFYFLLLKYLNSSIKINVSLLNFLYKEYLNLSIEIFHF